MVHICCTYRFQSFSIFVHKDILVELQQDYGGQVVEVVQEVEDIMDQKLIQAQEHQEMDQMHQVVLMEELV